MPGTILLGVDVESASEASRGYATHGARFYEGLETPVTFYVTGKSMEAYPDAFRALRDHPLIELQSHTYNHILLKPVLIQAPKGRMIHGAKDWFFFKAGTLEEIDADLTKCQEIFERTLGRPANALTAPWNYYRGLADRLDLLEMMRRHGFRAIRAAGRNERDGQPVPMEWQPYFYSLQGYPEILELYIHDYQDDFYWMAFGANSPRDSYAEHLKRIARKVADEDLVWSLCSHDHGCATPDGFEHKGAWLRALVNYAKDLGIRFLNVSAYYEEAAAGKK